MTALGLTVDVRKAKNDTRCLVLRSDKPPKKMVQAKKANDDMQGLNSGCKEKT